MSIIVRIFLGAVAGWLTGIAVADEGYGKIESRTHIRSLDIFYGIVGALVGNYLFFWTVMGTGDWFSDYATTILGSIAFVGVARATATKVHLLTSSRKNIVSSTETQHQPKDGLLYKDYLIRGESFQRERNGTWVAQFHLTRQNPGVKEHDFPSQIYQLSEVFPTEKEANDYAVQSAKRWVDGTQL